MNRFKLQNKKIKVIIFSVFIFLIVYIYISLFINSSLNTYVVNEIDKKYSSITNNSFKDTILYNQLNKIITLNDIKISNASKIIDTTKEEEINNTNKNTDKESNSETNNENKNDTSKDTNKDTNKDANTDKSTNVNNEVKDYKVYIYNTHDTEKYSLPFVSDYSIIPDVKLAAYILKDYLNDLGINTYVETRSINDYLKKYNLDYKGCYDASRSYMKDASKNNDFKIYIDLHRDSVKHKYTLFEYKGKKYAKLMFVLTTKHENYKKNQSVVEKLNSMINKKYKGLSRGIMKRSDVIFNQDLSSNAMLIELGGVDNTIEEINNTLEVLAEVLSEYIKEENL